MLYQERAFQARRMVTLRASFTLQPKAVGNVVYSWMEDEDAQVQKHQQRVRSPLPEEVIRLRA